MSLHRRALSRQPHPGRSPRTGICATILLVGLADAPAQAAEPPSAQPDATLPAINVTASVADRGGQHLDRSVQAGALGARRAIDTPFSVTTVTEQDIAQLAPAKLGDLFVRDAAVTDNGTANTAWGTYITVRGMELDWQNSFRIDGKPYLSYVVTLPFEVFEQVDLLKGASGFMHGFGTPGGLVNHVTKKPTDTPLREVTVGTNSDGLWTLSGDLGGRWGDADRFGYRLVATHEEGGTYNDGLLRRDAVLLSLDARLTSALTADLQVLRQDRLSRDADPTITLSAYTSSALPSAIRNDSRRLVGPGTYADNTFEFYSGGLTYQLAPDWTLRTNHSHSATRTRRNEAVFYLQDDAGDYTDFRADYGEAYQFNQSEASVSGRLKLAGLRHDVVLGASWQGQKNDYATAAIWQATGSGNLGATNTNTYHSVGGFDSLALQRAVRIEQKALFLSDTVRLNDQWFVLAGVRRTDYEQLSADASDDYSQSGVITPTLAVMHHWAPDSLAYASYVESLEAGDRVGTAYANAGTLLKPLRSKQYELGLKADRAGWSATAALFRIERGSQYEDANGALVQNGLSLYQGLELGTSTRLGRHWEWRGDLMLLDSSHEKGTDNIGNRVAGAARFVASTQLACRLPQLPGLRVHVGAKHTGNTMLRADNSLSTAGHTLWDLGATYDTIVAGHDTTLRASVHNLTDKRLWLYQYANYIKAQDPRRISVAATVRF